MKSFIILIILIVSCFSGVGQTGVVENDSLWVFYDDFQTKENENGWLLVRDESSIESKILPGTGLFMRSSSVEGFSQTINIPAELTEDIYIETNAHFKSGNKNSSYGLVFNSKDPDNYNCFVINANGYFTIEGKKNGVLFQKVNEKYSFKINKGYKDNIIAVFKKDNYIHYFINESEVYSEPYEDFDGNRAGFIVFEGRKQVIFNYVFVSQDKLVRNDSQYSQNTPNVTEPVDYALIYIYRKVNACCKACKFRVLINDQYIARLTENSMLTYKTYNAGVYELQFIETYNGWNTGGTLDVELGYEYIVVIKSALNGIKATITNSNDPDFKPEKVREKKKFYYTEHKKGNRDDNYSDNPSNVKGSGTGFAVSEDGYIATCYHVIENAEKINVRGINGDFTLSYSAKVIRTDASSDLAILKITDPDFESFDGIPYSIIPQNIDVGSSIYVLGFPFKNYMGEEVKLTNGIISSKSGFQGMTILYQVSAAAQPGNSGGPLFNEDGNIVGVVNAKYPPAENVTYAVKSPFLLNLVESVQNDIAIPDKNELAGMSLPEQVKILKYFVFLIEVE